MIFPRMKFVGIPSTSRMQIIPRHRNVFSLYWISLLPNKNHRRHDAGRPVLCVCACASGECESCNDRECGIFVNAALLCVSYLPRKIYIFPLRAASITFILSRESLIAHLLLFLEFFEHFSSRHHVRPQCGVPAARKRHYSFRSPGNGLFATTAATNNNVLILQPRTALLPPPPSTSEKNGDESQFFRNISLSHATP